MSNRYGISSRPRAYGNEKLQQGHIKPRNGYQRPNNWNGNSYRSNTANIENLDMNTGNIRKYYMSGNDAHNEHLKQSANRVPRYLNFSGAVKGENNKTSCNISELYAPDKPASSTSQFQQSHSTNLKYNDGGSNKYNIDLCDNTPFPGDLEFQLYNVYAATQAILQKHADYLREGQEATRKRATEEWLKSRTEEERIQYLNRNNMPLASIA